VSGSALANSTRQKLVNVLGPEEAEIVVRETLRRIGLAELLTPDDCYRFAVELVKQGGMLAIVGHAIRTQAFLHGAREAVGD
jgi:hypothetical protein